MRIKRLKLRNFRSYEQAEIRPGEGMTVFLGPNAQGKTNILESMHLCCAGRSHRTSRDEEMIRWGEAAAKVNIETAQRDGTHEVTLVLVRGQKKKKDRLDRRTAGRTHRGALWSCVRRALFS